MPTSTVIPSDPPRSHPAVVRGERGFTLVELGLVLLILGIAAGLLVPQFTDRSHAELVSQTRRLAVTFRYLRQEAILAGRTYRLYYDLSQHTYWVASADQADDPQGFTPESGLFARPVALPPPVGFSDIVFLLTAGKLFEGIGWTDFYPDGFVDPTVVHLDNGTESYTLRIEPLTGSVHVTDHYQDFDYGA